MRLQVHELQHLCDVAIDAAKNAGAIIQSYAGRDFSVKNKLTGSSPASQVVTEVDLKSQDTILQCIDVATKEYDLGLLIEESEDDLSRFEKDYFWCIDPLDGTLPFTRQKPGYSVSIGLVSREGESVIGVVYDPRTATLYHAVKNAGAFRNEKAWVLNTEFNHPYESVPEGGAVISACWALEQAPAYFMKNPKPQEGGGCLWDYAATVCLFEEMGCFCGDSYGQPLDLNSRDSLFMNNKGVLYASHKEIVEQKRRRHP